MQLDEQSQAILMLTASFGKSEDKLSKPLSTKEWSRFALWLRDHELSPADLLKADLTAQLEAWVDPKIPAARISQLLNRGAALGLAVEKWQRAGLWILTRSDQDYPRRLKGKLGVEAPPVLIGCGNKRLLGQGGVAIVGSRNASPDDLAFTKSLGEAASDFGKSVISGGARGVDITAMEASLKRDGTSVGVLADSLLRSATSSRFRKYLSSGSLVLVTPFNPEAPFNVGHAMARNKYVYCLSDFCVVVDSAFDKGGTWTGAIENQKNGWVPLFVKPKPDPASGNYKLIEKGACEATSDVGELYTKTNQLRNNPLADTAQTPSNATTNQPTDNELSSGSISNEGGKKLETESIYAHTDLYSLFLSQLLTLLETETMNTDEIAAKFSIEKSQARSWLARACSEGSVKKLQRPVRFCALSNANQASLFG